MRISVALIRFVAVLVFGVVVTGQTRPNFTGHWVQVSPADGAGSAQTIKHEGDRMTTGHDSEGGGHGVNYRLDGVESQNVLTSHGVDIVTKTKATWEGQQVVIVSATVYPDGRKMDDKQVWSLDGSGQLNIAITRTIAGQSSMSIKLVYAKRPID